MMHVARNAIATRGGIVRRVEKWLRDYESGDGWVTEFSDVSVAC